MKQYKKCILQKNTHLKAHWYLTFISDWYVENSRLELDLQNTPKSLFNL